MNPQKKQLFALLTSALVIASAPAISANIPEISKSFPTINQTFTSLFVTIPALFIIFGVFMTNLIEKKISQKKIILLGLLIVVIFGTLPTWYSKSFSVLFISRCILGLGIGLFNRLIIQNVGDLYVDNPEKKQEQLDWKVHLKVLVE